jgi:hypothetical protein
MLDVKDTQTATDHTDPLAGDPRSFAAAVNSWVPHDLVLKDAWFPLAHSFAVEEKPIRRAVYSQSYFLWRENGVAVGSEFHPNEIRDRAKSGYTDAEARYPVMEHYGYVWGWLGNPANADPAHLPSLPFLPPNGGLPKHMLGTVRFDCCAPLSLENLIDLPRQRDDHDGPHLHQQVGGPGDEILQRDQGRCPTGPAGDPHLSAQPLRYCLWPLLAG